MRDVLPIVQEAMKEAVARKKPPKTEWAGSPFEAFGKEEIDTRGAAGELLAVKLLEEGGRTTDYHANTTHQDKDWDFMCDGLRYEVKTATKGKSAPTFQHENIYKSRRYDGMILVDIAPDAIYISCWAKVDIPFGRLHRREPRGDYKWDTSLTSPRTMKGGKRNKFCVRHNRIDSVADFVSRFEEMERRIRARQRPDRSL